MNLIHPSRACKKISPHYLLPLLLLFLLALSQPAFSSDALIDINGTWSAGNLGTFFIRQIGNEVWWFGEDDPLYPTWANIAHGFMEGRTIKLQWTDVPKGISRLSGTVEYEIKYPNRLVRIAETGGFGVRDLEKAKAGVEEE